MSQQSDVIIVGGGHNGLVAAAYLARARLRVLVLEARERLGGAVDSDQVFGGVGARLSRFSYLVSLLPRSIVEDLNLNLELRSRRVASYAPRGDTGLLVEQPEGPDTQDSFARFTGSKGEYVSWCRFQVQLHQLASVVAPTLVGPLAQADELRGQIDPALWKAITQRPIGELIESRFADDTVRGMVLTDALIGLHSRAHDPTLRQNRCFLYHVIGNGTGEWKVPVGGMGRVTAEFARAAAAAGAQLTTNTRVQAVAPLDNGGAKVALADGTRLRAPHVLVNCAPAVLHDLLGEPQVERPSGSQTKINIVVRRLPRLRSGIAPETGFAGTLHLNQGYARLEQAFGEAAAGRIPDPLPCEVYCHSLADPSILSPELRSAGYHTLTIFGLHTPAALFRDNPDRARSQARDSALRSLQSGLGEPLEDCVARDTNGTECVEVMTPLDIEAELGMPGGHIFHTDLSWPWLEGETPDSPASRWGVATAYPGVVLCGAGSIRGGAVSGLGGHNAAMAVLETNGSAGR